MQGSHEIQLSPIIYAPFLSAAVIVVFTTAIVIVHKKQNNKNDKPEYCTAFASISAITENIKHNKSSFHNDNLYTIFNHSICL